MEHIIETASVTIGFDEEFVKRFRKYSLVVGIVLTLIGAAGMFVPQITALVAEIFLGWLLITAGIVAAYFVFLSQGRSVIAWLKPVLLILTGALFLVFPMNGIAAVALLLTIYLFLDAFASFGLAFDYRPLHGWLWMVVNGVLSLFLGFLVLIGWPVDSMILVGLYIGISLLFDGLALISMSLALARDANN